MSKTMETKELYYNSLLVLGIDIHSSLGQVLHHGLSFRGTVLHSRVLGVIVYKLNHNVVLLHEL